MTNMTIGKNIAELRKNNTKTLGQMAHTLKTGFKNMLPAEGGMQRVFFILCLFLITSKCICGHNAFL